MKINPKILLSIITSIWILLIGFSAFWNLTQMRRNHDEVNIQTGRSLFNLIVITREWNALHVGVYVPITDEVVPNPHLDDPLRDVETITGLKLTKLNPAYMTRLIAQIAATSEHVQFHITSLNPIRPENTPLDWERMALESFETGQHREYFDYYLKGGANTFRYMAPLETTASCLPCHEQQGYQEGDIRGGISVSFPAHFHINWALIFSHLGFAVVGVVLINVFGYRFAENIQILEQQSQIDGLTQIYNRRYFDEYLDREILRSRRAKTPLSILIGDIDHFKPYNDHYGHQAGDDCLKLVAKTLQELLKRPGDIVARYGGEEFVVVLPNTDLAGAQMLGETIRAKIEELELPHAASDVRAVVTISLGIGCWAAAEKEITANQLLESADQALYRAKSAGRNQVVG